MSTPDKPVDGTTICADCPHLIKGDHVRHNGEVLHTRCMRKRIEARPNFIGWV
jgi:hypothetical protein